MSEIACRAFLKDGVLTLENSLLRRRYAWNEGDLISLSLEDVARGRCWELNGQSPDLGLLDEPTIPVAGQLKVRQEAATTTTPAHLRVEVQTTLDALEVRRVFRLYPDCPAIACDLYLRGTAPRLNPAGHIDRLALPGVHWRARAVAFRDVTDRHNTLVRESSILPYRFEEMLAGNLLFLDEVLDDAGIFVLKEAPCGPAQLHYSGGDFALKVGEMRVVGSGVAPEDLSAVDWTRAYGVVVGVTGDGALGRLRAVRRYQEQIRLHLPGRDEMVLMNTWGDRGQDTRLGEAFALAELEAGARLGISHLQLDDGWQAGRSSNSAFAGGSLERIWDTPGYWQPHPERFSRGLGPVVERGKALGIEVCVWFNPSKDNGYAHWREDAETLIGLYRDHGIRTFKIDGVQVPDKRAETNLRCMFDAVRAATDDQAVFNLDVTAGQRYGYHYFNEYGNVFVENRYTDWSNYYPHWTLRNVWMLSRYVPAQNLQVEFLNVWRNAERYPMADPLAPGCVPFAYAFAITMMAQPLAWFEATGLPEQAFESAGLIRTYREHQTRIHAGLILPVGEEPSGTGWTGFQSLDGDSGYLLVFREYSSRDRHRLRLWGLAGRRVTFRHVLGDGVDFAAELGEDGEVSVSLPGPYTFGLYAYDAAPPGM